MKEMTAILLIIIALIGIISIIIVKLYYRDKEKDTDQEKLEEFINSTKAAEEDEKRRRLRKTAKKRNANLSEAQLYANTIDDETARTGKKVRKIASDEEIINNPQGGSTTALLRQRAKAMENAPKKQVRRVRKPQAEARKVPRTEVARKQVPRTPERVKTQMQKEEEVKPFQEPIKPEHTATINSVNQEEAKPKHKQVPMTDKQKEFIEKDAKKLVVDDTDGDVKVVKSIKPADSIEEIKEAAKIEDETTTVKDKVEEKVAEVKEEVETEATELKEEVETEATEVKDKVSETLAKAEEKVESKTTEVEEKVEEKATEVKDKVSEAIETAKVDDAKEKVSETISKIEEKVAETTDETEEEVKSTVEEIIPIKSETTEEVDDNYDKFYHDDLYKLLNKDAQVEEDTTPENDFVTINSDTETSSGRNDLFKDAINSIRKFRSANTPETPVVVETKDDIVPDDYAQDLGDGIEYIGDTITITPIREDEIDLAKNQPNEDVDKIYEEINGKPYNKTEDKELDESFEDVTDETSEKDANVYTKEDYIKIEKEEKDKKVRAENTKKILGLKGIEDIDEKSKSRRGRKPVSDDLEDGQKRLVFNKTKNDVEEVYINGTLFELKVGQVVMFDINGETYSSQILKLKPGYIGVRYRSKKIWVKSNSVKKILK